MRLDNKPKINLNFSINTLNNSIYFLTNNINGDVFEINDTSKNIINLCTGKLTIGEIINNLNSIDDSTCPLSIDDLILFLEELENLSIITIN